MSRGVDVGTYIGMVLAWLRTEGERRRKKEKEGERGEEGEIE